MSIDALNTSIATLANNVAAKVALDAAALAAATANTVPQADVDAAQAAVDVINATVAPAA